MKPDAAGTDKHACMHVLRMHGRACLGLLMRSGHRGQAGRAAAAHGGRVRAVQRARAREGPPAAGPHRHADRDRFGGVQRLQVRPVAAAAHLPDRGCARAAVAARRLHHCLGFVLVAGHAQMQGIYTTETAMQLRSTMEGKESAVLYSTCTGGVWSYATTKGLWHL